MARTFPGCPFERFADDGVIHCRTQDEARVVLVALRDRMRQVGLRLHPDKTGIVYCKDGKRSDSYDGSTMFDFLGFTFRARSTLSRQGRLFNGFNPAISNAAVKKVNATVRSWRLHRHITWVEADIARWINPIVRGWMTYYGSFFRSALYPVLARINAYLVRWMRKKYKRLRSFKAAFNAWKRAIVQRPRYFAQWRWVTAFWW